MLVYLPRTGKDRAYVKTCYRFFANDLRDTDRSGNLPAGTVVDRTVTHPFAFDFYLQAHAGLVGTVSGFRQDSSEIQDNPYDSLPPLTIGSTRALPRSRRREQIQSRRFAETDQRVVLQFRPMYTK